MGDFGVPLSLTINAGCKQRHSKPWKGPQATGPDLIGGEPLSADHLGVATIYRSPSVCFRIWKNYMEEETEALT